MDTILIVDDEKNYLVVLETLLGPEGYEIITSENARDALHSVREGDLDLIITDMKMPRMSGMDVLKKVKEDHPKVAVMIITGFGTVEHCQAKDWWCDFKFFYNKIVSNSFV